MSKYTKEDIWRMIEEEDVEFIRLQFTDIFGTLKNVAVTTSQLERVLNNEIMFDGASIEGGAVGYVPSPGSRYVCDLPVETPAGKGGAFPL